MSSSDTVTKQLYGRTDKILNVNIEIYPKVKMPEMLVVKKKKPIRDHEEETLIETRLERETLLSEGRQIVRLQIKLFYTLLEPCTVQ